MVKPPAFREVFVATKPAPANTQPPARGFGALNEDRFGRVILGRYVVTDAGVRSGTARVYSAFDIQTNRVVALKELDMSRMKEARGESQATSGEFKVFDLAEREARILKGINHPNVVKCLGHDKEDGGARLFIITEWVEGRNLAQLRKDEGRLTSEQVVSIMAQLLDTLGYMHGLNPPLVHRDIKPENIILMPDGRIKLVDFAFSISEQSTGTTSYALNSLGFTAPEVAQGRRGGPRSDLYSAGALYMWLRTGQNPLELENKNDAGTGFKFPENLSSKETEFLTQALAADPAGRFQDAEEMKAALEKLKMDGREIVPVEEQRQMARQILDKHFKYSSSIGYNFHEWFGRFTLSGVYTWFGMMAVYFLHAESHPKPPSPSSLPPAVAVTAVFVGYFVSIPVAGLALGMIENLACCVIAELPPWSGTKFNNWRAVSSARKNLLSGSITDPGAQETLADVMSKGPRSYWQLRAARKLLSNPPAPLSPKAEETLADMITKPAHAEKLLAAKQVRSPQAIAHLQQVAYATDADVALKLLEDGGSSTKRHH